MTPAAERQLCLAAYFGLRAELAEEEARRLEDEERDAAILDALQLYEHIHAPTTRADTLAKDLARYAACGWLREKDLAALPEKETRWRRAWHRILRSRDGETIGMRRIYDLYKSCNVSRSTLQIESSESRHNLI